MEDNFEQKSSGQASEEWRERLTHDDVMDKLSKIRGWEQQVSCDYGYCMQWHVDAPKVEELCEIVNRGVAEEIVYLIHQFGRALPPSEPPRGCTACNGGKWKVTVIPEKVQELIAKRGVAVEIATFVSYYGFGAKGQDVILERGNHDEIMWYLERHGLLLEQQRKLLARGNKDEIALHLAKHGMHEALLGEMFDGMEKGENLDLFYMCINGPEFSVKYQKRMLEVAKSPEFEAYVTRHGLWEDAHETLVEKRSDREVRFYIIKHHYLSSKASSKYIERGGTSDRLFFMKNSISGVYFAMETLLRLKPYDYEALEYGFNNYDYHKFEVDRDELNLMYDGLESQIIAYVENKRNLKMKSWATLFYRLDKNLFEKCLEIAFNR